MHVLQVEWQHSADDLQYLYRTETDGTLKPRLQALWFLRQGGRTRDEVASLVGAHPSTVQRWVDWYRAGGVREVLRHRSGGDGPHRRVTPTQEARLTEEAKSGRFRHIDEVRRWVQDTFDVPYTYWGMRSVLDRLRIHSKVPRPQAATADPARQASWKKGA